MIATGIPLRDLHLAWPDLWPLLEPAVRRTPDKPDVLARLIARDAQLWAVYDDGQGHRRHRDADSPAIPTGSAAAVVDRRQPRRGVGGRLPLQARALGALAGLRRALGIRP